MPLPTRLLPLEQAIRDALGASATQQGRRPVLVLDEAHWLTVPLFNTLRRLLHFAMDTTAPFALILAGHTELRQKLALRPREAMRQRVTLAYPRRPFPRDETAASRHHHLQQVGVDRPVFTDAAIAAGHDWAQVCRAGSTGGRKPVYWRPMGLNRRWSMSGWSPWPTRNSSGQTLPNSPAACPLHPNAPGSGGVCARRRRSGSERKAWPTKPRSGTNG